jgi:hypothetical protein
MVSQPLTPRPQFYSYYDYIDAWFHAFLYQNNLYGHSWFFQFDKQSRITEPPMWFYQWWNTFVAEEIILASPLASSFEIFYEYDQIPSSLSFSKLLSFYLHHKLP